MTLCLDLSIKKIFADVKNVNKRLTNLSHPQTESNSSSKKKVSNKFKRPK